LLGGEGKNLSETNEQKVQVFDRDCGVILTHKSGVNIAIFNMQLLPITTDLERVFDIEGFECELQYPIKNKPKYVILTVKVQGEPWRGSIVFKKLDLSSVMAFQQLMDVITSSNADRGQLVRLYGDDNPVVVRQAELLNCLKVVVEK
jgi:hypothetical protein